MKKTISVLFIAVIALLGSLSVFAEKYRVTDEYVTFYNSPERISALGRMERGTEFDVIGTDGSMLIFKYNGRNAYVASYCCAPVPPAPAPRRNNDATEAPTSSSHERPIQQPQNAHAAPADTDNEVQPNYFEFLDRWQSNIRSDERTEIPQWVAFLFAIFGFLGIGTGFWVLFGHGRCEDFFDDLADAPVSRGRWIRYFRPVGVFFIGAFFGYITNNIYIALAAAAAYESILLLFRTKRFGSLRAAVVEALFLGLRAIGALFLCFLFLIFMFLASGGSGSSRKKGKKGYMECNDCKFYNPNSYTCGLGYRQDGTCEQFRER